MMRLNLRVDTLSGRLLMQGSTSAQSRPLEFFFQGSSYRWRIPNHTYDPRDGLRTRILKYLVCGPSEQVDVVVVVIVLVAAAVLVVVLVTVVALVAIAGVLQCFSVKIQSDSRTELSVT